MNCIFDTINMNHNFILNINLELHVISRSILDRKMYDFSKEIEKIEHFTMCVQLPTIVNKTP